MIDILPFPRMIGNNADERLSELYNYLIQFKETLEFVLANISTENLSPDLVNKLNELGAGIEKNSEELENNVAQLSVNSLTIYEVCESDLLKSTIKKEINETVNIKVNYETGHLEYLNLYEGG